MIRPQQPSRKFCKCLEHREDEVLLMDKVEWDHLYPKNT